MSKRVDRGHDATQEVSASQLVPQHDASMWMQSVVSSDDFAPAAKQRSRTGRRPLMWGVALVLGAAAAGAAVWYTTMRDDGSTGVSASAAEPSAATAPDPAAGVTPPVDAAIDAAIDTAVDTAVDAPIDEPPAAPALEVDAVSSVGAIVTPTTKQGGKKKPATKKKVVRKKKPAATKRR